MICFGKQLVAFRVIQDILYLVSKTFIFGFGEESCKHFFVIIALNSVKASVCAFQKCSRLQLRKEEVILNILQNL